MRSEIVKESLQKLSESLSFNYPATGWYFSAENIENSFVFKKDRWVCLFIYWARVMKSGKRIQFSKECGKACTGIAEFGGFTELIDDEGEFIAETERFKKNRKLAQAYHRQALSEVHPPPEPYLYFEKIEKIDGHREIEVINLYPNPTGLTKLSGISNYDREADSVILPFASGCQSAFSIPYHQKFQETPKSVVGLMDSLVRNFVPDDMIMFSIPSNRFVEMANNIEGSFLDKNFENPTSF